MAHIKLYILNCIFSYKIYYNNEYIFSAFSNSNILTKAAYVSFIFTFYFHRNITVELFFINLPPRWINSAYIFYFLLSQ